MDVATILLVAQVSSAITCVIGLQAIYYMIKAAKGLLPGEFRDLIINSSIFLVLLMIGVISMTYYHMTGNGSDMAESLWYWFIFISVIYSFYESYKVIEFGKPFAKLQSWKKRK